MAVSHLRFLANPILHLRRFVKKCIRKRRVRFYESASYVAGNTLNDVEFSVENRHRLTAEMHALAIQAHTHYGIVNLFVKWRILMGYKEESSGRYCQLGT